MKGKSLNNQLEIFHRSSYANSAVGGKLVFEMLVALVRVMDMTLKQSQTSLFH